MGVDELRSLRALGWKNHSSEGVKEKGKKKTCYILSAAFPFSISAPLPPPHFKNPLSEAPRRRKVHLYTLSFLFTSHLPGLWRARRQTHLLAFFIYILTYFLRVFTSMLKFAFSSDKKKNKEKAAFSQ